MIQPSELRIGNLLLNAGGIAVPTTAQTISDLELKLIVRKPITLTEEWLLKAGFEESVDESNESIYSKWYSINDKSTTIFSINVTNEDIMPDDVEIKDFDIYDGDRYIKSVKSLHQLQNLYFALTGKELEFKI